MCCIRKQFNKVLSFNQEFHFNNMLLFTSNMKKSFSIILTLAVLIWNVFSDNVCSYHIGSKVFTTLPLQLSTPYSQKLSENKTIVWNFCMTFQPKQCQNNSTYAYVFLIQTVQNLTKICIPYTSDSYLYYMNASYQKDNDKKLLVMDFFTKNNQSVSQKQRNHTVFEITCSKNKNFQVLEVKHQLNKILIRGSSSSGCPLLQISAIWTTLSQNSFVLGIIIFGLGVYCLFFGRQMIILTIFIASFFCAFILLVSLLSLMLGPDSNLILIYFSLIVALFLSTIFGYVMTKFMYLSIFFIGAWLGFVVAALVNSLFSSIFNVYSTWTLVIFDILFIIPLGILTFKYSDYIIILSTAISGSYMVVRPISWVLGGFPNEFILEQLYQSEQLNTLPWGFFLYLILIITLAIIGGIYQFLKLMRQSRQDIDGQFVPLIQNTIQKPIDKVKGKIVQFVNKERQQKKEEKQQKQNIQQLKTFRTSKTRKQGENF